MCGGDFEIPETEGSLIMIFFCFFPKYPESADFLVWVFPYTQNQWLFEISKELPNIGLSLLMHGKVLDHRLYHN